MKKTILLLALFIVSIGVGGAVEAETTSGVKSTMQTQVRTGVSVDVDTEIDVRAGDADEDGSPDRVLPTVNKVEGEESSERVLPTVNKAESDEDSESARLLPTVNKKTGAKVIVRGWDPEKRKEISGTVDTTIESDENIRSVEMDEQEVNVEYETSAKLFGFIPITMNMHVSSDAEGRVKVRFPWYRFLVTTEYADTGSAAEAVFQNNQTNLQFLRSRDTVRAQLEAFIIISNVLKTKHDTVKNSINNVR